MKITIQEQTKQNGINRTEVKATITGTKTTPSREQVSQALQKELAAKNDTLIIKEVKTHFGSPQILVHAYVYENKDDIKRYEKEFMIKRNTPKKTEEAQA
ncbi:MAG: 30S ribosomal protein S24e [Candidatus Woesearchaeota archaeon]